MLCQIDNKNMKNSAFTLAEGATHVDTQNNSCQSLVCYSGGATQAVHDIENLCKIGVSDAAATLPPHSNSLPKGARGQKENIPSLEGRGSKGVGENENQPSPQPSPIGEGVGKKILNRVQDDENNFLKRTYSLINLFSYSPRKRAAFTLAEVLITLGIIGVVAALTMPALIANYQKRVTVTRLKEAYSILSQAVRLSENDNGEARYWENYSNQIQDGQDHITSFAETYIIPYIKSNVIGNIHPDDINIKAYRGLDGSIVSGIMYVKTYIVRLNNGQDIFMSYNTYDGTYREVFFYIDVNGAEKNPNVLAKDTFLFYLDFNSGTIRPYGSAEDCSKNNSRVCAAKIIQDGWQITKNYPW